MRKHLLITILFVLTAAAFPASVAAPAGSVVGASFTAVWGTKSQPESDPADDQSILLSMGRDN